jgi:glyoxylase-like metal-dependent hydrolase (beta-lactamase superfamily II)
VRRIVTIDCQYLFPQYAAAYLLVDGDHAAFIENNTAHSVPLLLQALKENGLQPEQVDAVIVTHVHLDHAGGTSQLMRACPKATLLAHPRAAKHLIDPTKLIASARKVYGDEVFDRLYGKIEPIDASRVRTVADEEVIPFGASGAGLRFMHTRGHANHHACIFDEATRSIFTGDSFGVAYPALQKDGLFILPSTSPTDFDYAEAVRSVDRIVASGAARAYLTHFGPISELEPAAAQLKTHLAFSEDLLNRATQSELADEELTDFYLKEIEAHFAEPLRKFGPELLKLDLEINAAGLAFVTQKRRHPQESS